MCKVKFSCCIHEKDRLVCVIKEEMISFSVPECHFTNL